MSGRWLRRLLRQRHGWKYDVNCWLAENACDPDVRRIALRSIGRA